ncbi:MAG: LpxI family protein [Candidatus Tectomicrobia bacterium]|uniref:LpxI family protein n=1 Tax=Tectimicrobiota bacterium TaxID=2528274 RepID=A0A938B312_UNCTE|nr:LpxI family protein [Candidatus Tectomicrobia bacterium]
MAHVGMIAGAGELPEIIARRAYAEGTPLPTVALSAEVAAHLTPFCPTLAQYGPGQLTKIIRTFQYNHVQQVVMVGKVEKRFLFENPRLDWRALRGLSSMRDFRDVTLLHRIIAEFAREGLEVIEQTRLLSHLLTPAGVLGKRRPSQRVWDDIRYGFAQARQLAAADIGQTIVVRRQTVMAVEALEGTDATIQRGCHYGGRGTVVIKVSRPQQDMRFDVPAVGPRTLQEVITGRAEALAVEASTTLMLHLPELVAMADAHRVALVGVSAAALSLSDSSGRGE